VVRRNKLINNREPKRTVNRLLAMRFLSSAKKCETESLLNNDESWLFVLMHCNGVVCYCVMHEVSAC